jgi:hypothetical protein
MSILSFHNHFAYCDSRLYMYIKIGVSVSSLQSAHMGHLLQEYLMVVHNDKIYN